ncbi:hypothetical protein Tco_0668136 [Tanacetum coccineum]
MLLNVDQPHKKLGQSKCQTRSLFEYSGREVQHSEIHYSNTWVLLRSPLLKEHVHQRQYDKKESIRTDSTVQDDSSRSGNDTDVDDADIRPIYDEEPMAEVLLMLPAKKKIQERDRNSTTSVPTSARIQTTTDDRKPNPRSNNQTSRSLPVSKSSRVTITVVPKADHSKSGNPRVEFSNLLVLGGFLQESYSTLAQARMTVNPHMVQM